MENYYAIQIVYRTSYIFALSRSLDNVELYISCSVDYSE